MKTRTAKVRQSRRHPTLPALALACGILAGGCASGSQGSDSRTPAVMPDQNAQLLRAIPAGTHIDVRLEQTLSTEESQVGDRWTAVVQNDVTDGQHVLLQRGAVVAGEVTRAGPMEIEGDTHQVLAVRPVELRAGGQVYPIDADVVAADQRESDGLFSRESLVLVGGGALAGSILGEILLDEALLGALLGAAGGSAIAIATREETIEMRGGSTLTLAPTSSVSPTVTSGSERR